MKRGTVAKNVLRQTPEQATDAVKLLLGIFFSDTKLFKDLLVEVLKQLGFCILYALANASFKLGAKLGKGGFDHRLAHMFG